MVGEVEEGSERFSGVDGVEEDAFSLGEGDLGLGSKGGGDAVARANIVEGKVDLIGTERRCTELVGVGLGEIEEVVEDFGFGVGGDSEDLGFGSGEGVGQPDVGAATAGGGDDQIEFFGEFSGGEDKCVVGGGGTAAEGDTKNGFAGGVKVGLDLVGVVF